MRIDVELVSHAVIGHLDVLKNYLKFKGFFKQLLETAVREQPDVVLLVDYSGFNLRFAKAIRERIAAHWALRGWNPKIIYFVSPQFWASREGRLESLKRNVDLVLSIIPFEKDWYARRLPGYRVEFVGHPMITRYASHLKRLKRSARIGPPYNIVLFPGSRRGEVSRHWPVMLEVIKAIASRHEAEFTVVLPDETLATSLRQSCEGMSSIQVRVGDAVEALCKADLAITKSGTITLECAVFRVPAVVIYKTSWLVYQIGRHVVRVSYLAMPNLIAQQAVYPELIQSAATPSNILKEAESLLIDADRRTRVQQKLNEVVHSLGKQGAAKRAADVVWEVLG